MYTCTLNKDGVAAPEIARIQLNAYSHHIFDIAAQLCLQCVQPECLRYCPQGAIHIDEGWWPEHFIEGHLNELTHDRINPE